MNAAYAYSDGNIVAVDQLNLVRKNYVGFLFGALNSTKGNPPGAGLNMGGNFGFQLVPQSAVYLGAFATYGVRFSSSHDGILESGESVSLIGPELTFRDLFNTGLYLGARAGIGSRAAGKSFLFIPIGYDSFTAYGAGPTLGYDITLTEQFSMGLDFSLMVVSGGTVDLGYYLSKTELPVDHLFNSLISFKYKF
jgi:hypothetical protein